MTNNLNPLAETLRLAEQYYRLHLQLDGLMRRGYVCLVGARQSPGMFMAFSWPENEDYTMAVQVVEATNVATKKNEIVFPNAKQQQARLRRWSFDRKPSPDSEEAMECFTSSLKLVNEMSEIAQRIQLLSQHDGN